MKAVLMTQPGPPEVLSVADIPEPGITHDTDVKIQLKAAGINPIDTKIRGRGVFYPDGLPAVLGCDGAGIVLEVGKAVQRFKSGDAVWFCHGGLGGEQGNYAQYTVVDEALLSSKPTTWSFDQAAAAPLVLITAWEALFDRARLQSGETVLIHAGAGGVGHIAIQLAKQHGARVCTTVSSAEKAAFVRELGADYVIDYRQQDVVETVRQWTEGRGVDVIFDTVGPAVLQQSLAAAAYRGRLVTLLDPGTDIHWKEARDRNLSISFELMLTPMLNKALHEARLHQVAILDQCRELAEAGKLSIHVTQQYTLFDAMQAHQAIEAGHSTGKLVLIMDN
jgi:NADPH2:quinone reductase